MGKSIPKPLLPLGDKTVIWKTVSTLLSTPLISEAILLSPSESIELYKKELSEFLPRLEIIAGGKSRQESVLNALTLISKKENTDSDLFVLVHDGARCFLSSELLKKSIENGIEKGALTCALPLVDSIKLSDGQGTVVKSLSRDNIWTIQTPQIFQFNLIFNAHNKYAKENCFDFTDDASMVESEKAVYLLEGERRNFKITTPEDYELACALISLEHGQ